MDSDLPILVTGGLSVKGTICRIRHKGGDPALAHVWAPVYPAKTLREANMRNCAAIVLMVLASACAEDRLNFSDSVDFEFDFHLLDFGSPQDSIHDPYVVGSSFRMYASRDNDDMNVSEAWPVSLAPMVLAVEEVTNGMKEHLWWDVNALSPGAVRVDVRKNQLASKSWDHIEVQVLMPDRVELYFAGWQLLNLPERDFPEPEVIDVLVGGTGTFLVQYYTENRRLNGNGALTAVPADDQVDAEPIQTYWFEDREWLAITPWSAGIHEIKLYAGNHYIQTLRIRGVTPEDTAYILLHDEGRTHNDASNAILAVGYTDTDVPVYGIECQWELDGSVELGEGDLYRYTVDRDSTKELVASFGPLSERIDVQIKDDSGWVTSSNNVGCDSMGRTTSASGLVLLLASMLLLARIRCTSVQK